MCTALAHTGPWFIVSDTRTRRLRLRRVLTLDKPRDCRRNVVSAPLHSSEIFLHNDHLARPRPASASSLGVGGGRLRLRLGWRPHWVDQQPGSFLAWRAGLPGAEAGAPPSDWRGWLNWASTQQRGAAQHHDTKTHGLTLDTAANKGLRRHFI